MRSRLLTIVAVIGLAAPMTGIAQSYLTPEDVLQQNDNAFLVPSHHRGARWTSDLEAQLSRDRHPSVIQDPWDPVQDNGLPPPVQQDDFANLDQSAPPVQSNPYGNLDPITARLLARLEQQNSILASSLQSTAGQNGAPLAQTGPAAILSVIVMLVATVLTLRRARILEKFVRDM